MKNSDERIEAETVIAAILEATDESYVYRKINQPIEEAAMSYSYHSIHPADVSHELFNDIIQDFVTHLFSKGHSIRMSSKIMALTEAVSIIETVYQSSNNGYDAAFVDATDPKINGLEIILHQIKEIVIAVSRSRYIQWVYDSYLTPLNWSTKIVIVQILREQWKMNLPLKIQNISPARMADDIPFLISTIQDSENKYRRSLGRHNV